MKKKECLFICQTSKSCKAREYCEHARNHEEKKYSKGNFMFEFCTEEHQCQYQEKPVRCRKVRLNKKCKKTRLVVVNTKSGTRKRK